MNKDILLKILNEHEIPPWMYSLDGVSDPNGDQICIIKNDKNWDVFQNNRGQLDLLKTFDVENDAYEYIYTVFKRTYGW